MLVTAKNTGVRQGAARRDGIGSHLRRIVPLGIGVIQTDLGACPEIRPGRRPGRRYGELGKFASAFPRVDLVMTDFGDQLELIGNCIHRTRTYGNPVLIAAILSLVLLIDHLELTAETRRQAPVEVLHYPPAFGAATQGHVAGVPQPSTWTFTVLHSEGIAAAKETDLLVLRRDGPSAVGIFPVRFVDVADAKLQFAAWVAVETADVEIVTIDVPVLEDVVLTGKRIAV